MPFLKIEVSSHQDRDGVWIPERFIWERQVCEIDDIGRRWKDINGEHLLVMDSKQQTYELVYSSSEKCWYLNQRQIPNKVI